MPEATLAESIQSAIAEHAPATETADTPSAEAPETTAASAPESAPADKPAATRAPDGKFAKDEPATKSQVASTVASGVAGKPLMPPAPHTWRKEAQGKWEAVDPDIKAEIIKREMDAANGIREYKTQAQEAAAYKEAIEPYRESFQKLGATPMDVVKSLLPTAQMLYFGSPAQKMQALVQTAQNFGIDIGQMSQFQQPPADPNVRQIQQQLAGLQQSVQAQNLQQQQVQQAQVQAEQQKLQTEITQFAASHEHFNAVKDQMAGLLNAGMAQSLDDAYAKAVFANDELRAQIMQQSQAAQRAKAAAVSVKSGSPSGSTAAPENPQDRMSAIRFAISQHSR